MTSLRAHRAPWVRSTWREPIPASAYAVAAGAVFACVVLGVAAGFKPEYAILGVFGIGFVFAVFADLAFGVGFFAAFTFLDSLSSGGFDKVAGLLLIVSWGLRRGTRARSDPRTIISRHPRIFAWLVVLLVYSLVSAAWAVDSGVAIGYVYRDILQFALIPIVYSAVNTRRDVEKIVIGFLIGGIISAVYGFVHPVAAGAMAAGRTVGTIGDPNQEAAALVAALALAIGLAIVAKRSPKLGALALAAAVICFVGTITTYSRSGLLALLGAILVAAAFGGRWRPTARKLVVIALIAVAGYLVLFHSSSSSRVTSTSTDGRSSIWTVGWRMFEAHPVIGVGAGNFQQASYQYLQRPGLITAAQFVVVTPKVAHNIYLEQLATLGVPGLIIVLAIFGGGIVAILRAAHLFERIGDPELDLLTRCCAFALVGFMISDFFISGLQTKQFWLLFGLGLGLAKLAEIESAGARV